MALKYSRAGSNCVINDEHNYRADRSYHDARQVHAGNSDETKFVKIASPTTASSRTGTRTVAVGDDVTQSGRARRAPCGRRPS